MNMIAAANETRPKAWLTLCTLLPAETVTGVLLATGGFVDWGTLPVGCGTVVFPEGCGTPVLVTGGAAEQSEDVGMTGLAPSILAKLAQLMRVLLG